MGIRHYKIGRRRAIFPDGKTRTVIVRLDKINWNLLIEANGETKAKHYDTYRGEITYGYVRPERSWGERGIVLRFTPLKTAEINIKTPKMISVSRETD